MTAEYAATDREALAVVCLLSVFAMCVEASPLRLLTAVEDEYRLVAERVCPGRRFLAVWRTKPLADPEATLITIAKAPGVRHARLDHRQFGAVPLDDLGSHWLFAELWGVCAEFNFPTGQELEALRRLAWL